MNPSTTSANDISLKTLEQLIKMEQKRLEEDKLRLLNNEGIKKRRSDGNHYQPFQNITLPIGKNPLLPNNVRVNSPVEDNCTLKDKSTFMIKNPREEKINKLIDEISKPKEQQSFPCKRLNKSFPQARSNFSQYLSPVNIREREKDQLSEKFATSECPFTKPSCRQIAKNLYSSITFNDFKQNNLENAGDRGPDIRNVNKEYFSGGDKNKIIVDQEEYLRAKYNHPRIVVSRLKESNKNEEVEVCKDNKMVRIGEFSPLNPNLPGGATVLGLGEWDEKRQLLLQKYRQGSRSPSPSQFENGESHNHRSIATQTDSSDDWSSGIPLEKGPQHSHKTPEKCPQTLHGYGQGYGDVEGDCSSPQFRLSPIPKCFENMTEKEVKEFIYRRDLENQIEEKNKMKEEMRKKEAEEEAKIEAKIQRDLEKMKQQYEEERLQRLELAIRRREQEDILRQKLAVGQQKAMQESKIIKKKVVNDSDLLNYTNKKHEKGTQSSFKKPSNTTDAVSAPYNRSLPEQSAASALSNVHEELRQPLLQPSRNLLSADRIRDLQEDKSLKMSNSPLKKTKKSTRNTTTASPPISVRRSREVDILAQQAVFDTNINTTPRTSNVASIPSEATRDRLRDVDNILKEPLLPESRVLPPVSQPLLHATIPPMSASLQIPKVTVQSASSRTNTFILEDKWRVPYVEQDLEASNMKHNSRILTQLGTFRRQLQEESLRMRQRVREDSP